jgi:hypothetical protein
VPAVCSIVKNRSRSHLAEVADRLQAMICSSIGDTLVASQRRVVGASMDGLHIDCRQFVNSFTIHLAFLHYLSRCVGFEQNGRRRFLNWSRRNRTGTGDSAKQTRAVRDGAALQAEPHTFFGQHRDQIPIHESLQSLGTKGTGPPRSGPHPRCLAFVQQRRSPCFGLIPPWT